MEGEGWVEGDGWREGRGQGTKGVRERGRERMEEGKDGGRDGGNQGGICEVGTSYPLQRFVCPPSPFILALSPSNPFSYELISRL